MKKLNPEMWKFDADQIRKVYDYTTIFVWDDIRDATLVRVSNRSSVRRMVYEDVSDRDFI